MFNYLLEMRNDYTNHLSNMISPFIYEGFKKMYNDIAFPKSLPTNQYLNKDEILNFFQKCLKLCKDWDKSLIGNKTIIENETNRILSATSIYGYLPDLIKATLKSHLVILMYNPSCTNQIKIDATHYTNIPLDKFFYMIYIEFAKELWCNPYLMYHDYTPIEIKKNQRECILLIKECIKEGINKLLPFKQILYNYLREDLNNEEIQFNQINNSVIPNNNFTNNMNTPNNNNNNINNNNINNNNNNNNINNNNNNINNNNNNNKINNNSSTSITENKLNNKTSEKNKKSINNSTEQKLFKNITGILENPPKTSTLDETIYSKKNDSSSNENQSQTSSDLINDDNNVSISLSSIAIPKNCPKDLPQKDLPQKDLPQNKQTMEIKKHDIQKTNQDTQIIQPNIQKTNQDTQIIKSNIANNKLEQQFTKQYENDNMASIEKNKIEEITDSNDLDKKLKNILTNDLNMKHNYTGSETSLDFNNDFQEIFSNSK